MKETYAILFKRTPREQERGADFDRLGPEEVRVPEHRLGYEEFDEKQAAEAAQSSDVEMVVPVMDTVLVEPLASPPGGGADQPWGIAAVGADRTPATGNGVSAAVLDTGIDSAHPCFAGMDIDQRDFTGTGNGDERGHGTHCAATLFGQKVGDIRYGVAPGISKAYIGKVLAKDGHGSTQMIFDALEWAINLRVNVISMSLGIDFPARVQKLADSGMPTDIAASRSLDAFRRTVKMFEAIVELAKRAEDFGHVSIVVAAAGNGSRRQINPNHTVSAIVPAVISDVSVGALGREGGMLKIAPFSNSMPTLVAPGADILSAWPGQDFKTLNGTSMACPHVAGVAALWLEHLRQTSGLVTRTALKSHMIASARRDLFAPGVSPADVGYGLAHAPS